jgi:hypothetical protein
MKRGNVPTQSWSGKSAVFIMDVPRLQQVEQKAVGRQRNLRLGEHADHYITNAVY